MVLRRLDRADEEVMQFLGEEPALNLFIIGDVENFGYRQEFMDLWGDFDERLRTVLLRYTIIQERDDWKVIHGKTDVIEHLLGPQGSCGSEHVDDIVRLQWLCFGRDRTQDQSRRAAILHELEAGKKSIWAVEWAGHIVSAVPIQNIGTRDLPRFAFVVFARSSLAGAEPSAFSITTPRRGGSIRDWAFATSVPGL